MIRNSVKAPGSVSTSIAPPCCSTTTSPGRATGRAGSSPAGLVVKNVRRETRVLAEHLDEAVVLERRHGAPDAGESRRPCRPPAPRGTSSSAFAPVASRTPASPPPSACLRRPLGASPGQLALLRRPQHAGVHRVHVVKRDAHVTEPPADGGGVVQSEVDRGSSRTSRLEQRVVGARADGAQLNWPVRGLRVGQFHQLVLRCCGLRARTLEALLAAGGPFFVLRRPS